MAPPSTRSDPSLHGSNPRPPALAGEWIRPSGFACLLPRMPFMTTSARATPSVYVGLFLVTLATLVFEILLTRIFSITLWYHFAFMAISVAMFGITVGALVVHLRPSWFPPEKLTQRLAESALCFGVLIVVSVLVHL